jgi:uncharacterized RmlC-like cupin family protein
MEKTMNTVHTVIRRNVGKFVAMAAIASTLAIPAASTVAQDVKLAGGTSTETLGSISAVEGSGSRLVLMRFTLDPGASIRRHSHPGTAVITVVSGVLETELVRGSATINRAGVEESAEIGSTIELTAGDSIACAENAGKTMANGGEEPLVLVASMLLDPNQPVFNFDFWPVQFQPHLQ